MGRVILVFIGAAIAAVVQMAWGFAFWMATPIPYDYMVKPMPPEKEGAVVKALTDSNLETGHYFYPAANQDAMTGKNDAASKEFQKKHTDGPLVELVYNKTGLTADAMMMTYPIGTAHFFGCNLLFGFVLLLASRGLTNYFKRLLAGLLIALFAPVAITLSDPIWYHHPWTFALTSAGFYAVAWVLAAIVMAAFVRPPKAAVSMQRLSKSVPLMPHDFHPSDQVRR